MKEHQRVRLFEELDRQLTYFVKVWNAYKRFINDNLFMEQHNVTLEQTEIR